MSEPPEGMVVDPMIEKFARAVCTVMDPDTLVVDYPRTPMKVNGRDVAFASQIPAPYPVWRLFWSEGYLMAQAYWEEKRAEACPST